MGDDAAAPAGARLRTGGDGGARPAFGARCRCRGNQARATYAATSLISPLAWPFDPSVYAGLVVFSAGYVLLARGRGFRFRNGAWFALGVLTLWVALETPID